MVKSIIKRIIVGVGIALCLMAIKERGLICQVHALEPYNDIPDTVSYWSGISNSATDNVRQFNFYNTDFWGYSYQGSTSMQGVSFNFNSDSYLSDKTGSVNFAIYSQVRNDWRKPFQVYIKDYYNNISSCYTDSTSIANNGSRTSSPISSVICPNVQIRGNYSIFISNLTPDTSLTIAISKVTFKFLTDKDIKSAIDNNTKAQEKTNDTLNNSTTDNPSSDISSMNGKLASNGSITQLLTLPIQMYQSILNSVSGSCSPFSLGSLYNHDLTLPCINLKNLLGSTLYGIIDILISGLFILSFRKKMVDIFNHMTSLNDRGNEVE